MLYLIFRRDITVGQFFSLWIYSFFIFGPLQELGNVINIYRETEASLNVFERILGIPKEPKPVRPMALDDVRTLEFDDVTFQHQSAAARRPSATSRSAPRAARRSPSSDRPVPARRRWSSCWSGFTRRCPAASCITASRAPTSTSTCCASASASSRRTRSSSRARFARICCSSIPKASDAGVPDRPTARRVRKPAGTSPERTRYGDRRGRREGVGRREAAPVDRPRAAATSAAAGLRRSDVVSRLADRGRDRRHHQRGGRHRRVDHHPDRPSPVHHPARRPHLRARARPNRRNRPARRARGAQGPVLRDVAAANWGAPRGGKRRRQFSVLGSKFSVLSARTCEPDEPHEPDEPAGRRPSASKLELSHARPAITVSDCRSD